MMRRRRAGPAAERGGRPGRELRLQRPLAAAAAPLERSAT